MQQLANSASEAYRHVDMGVAGVSGKNHGHNRPTGLDEAWS
jgi:hypothetical protein